MFLVIHCQFSKQSHYIFSHQTSRSPETKHRLLLSGVKVKTRTLIRRENQINNPCKKINDHLTQKTHQQSNKPTTLRNKRRHSELMKNYLRNQELTGETFCHVVIIVIVLFRNLSLSFVCLQYSLRDHLNIVFPHRTPSLKINVQWIIRELTQIF